LQQSVFTEAGVVQYRQVIRNPSTIEFQNTFMKDIRYAQDDDCTHV